MRIWFLHSTLLWCYDNHKYLFCLGALPNSGYDEFNIFQVWLIWPWPSNLQSKCFHYCFLWWVMLLCVYFVCLGWVYDELSSVWPNITSCRPRKANWLKMWSVQISFRTSNISSCKHSFPLFKYLRLDFRGLLNIPFTHICKRNTNELKPCHWEICEIILKKITCPC